VLILTQDRRTVCTKCTIGSEIILDVPNLGDEAQVEYHFGPFGVVLILKKDRCIVYVERIIGTEIILDAPDGTPR
jgi:hypothetical protein